MSATRSAPRFGRFQKATALVPLALLSAAVTASFVGAGPAPTAVAGEDRPSTLPDGSSMPTEAVTAPASVTSPGVVAPGLNRGDAADAISTASASGIPAAALAAYQRAETVINTADPSCHLPWQLVAAIGRVESDHGRANGNVLDDDGAAVPGIFGIPLNGKNGTQAIRDSDAGQYDADAKWDRAVGPMQFIPTTWSVVGVDGDNDGQRNPQDIDDAALATAVYLCSGKGDLSREVGQRAAVYRYNHSDDYVDLVLSFMNAYMSGEFVSVPNSVTSTFDTGGGFGGVFTTAPHQGGGKGKGGKKHGGKNGHHGGGNGGSGNGGGGGGQTPVTPPGDGGSDNGGGGLVPDLPDLPDVGLPGTGGNGGGNGGGSGGSGGGGNGGAGGSGGGGGVDDTVDQISKDAAKKLCLAEVGVSSVLALLGGQKAEYNACMAKYGY